MRWWLQTNPPYLMSVDNATVKGMDYSALLATEPDLWMAQWTDGKGEIERLEIDENNEAQNLNGLREPFIDVIPYAPLFQQFLRLVVGLLLPQAKKVQVDLIRQIFESKRQAPFHHPITAGDYYWDATDETLFSSIVPGLQNSIATINNIATQLNALVPAINGKLGALIGQINAGIVAPGDSLRAECNNLIVAINTVIAAGVNNLADEINANIVTDVNTNIVGGVNGNIVGTGNYVITHINEAMLGDSIGAFSGPNVINNKLQRIQVGFTSEPVYAAHGLQGSIAKIDVSFSGIGGIGAGVNHINGIVMNFVSDFTPCDVAGLTWTPLAPVPTSNVQWIPIGATAPVTVTPAEQAAILNGIAARTNDLSVKKNAKIAAVNSKTNIDDVINYDVTVGW